MRPALDNVGSAWLVLAVGLLVAAVAPAQVVDDANAGIQLSFPRPARGVWPWAGRFSGLADDPPAPRSSTRQA